MSNDHKNALTPTRYIPSLDGLRAISILLVVIGHGIPENILPAAFGVTLFFFISGYLLTIQMINEFRRKGRLNYKNFYLRRLLRLAPAALVFIMASGCIFILIGGTISPIEWIAALLYGANYYDLFIGF